MKTNPHFNKLQTLLFQRDDIYRMCPENWGKVPQDTKYVVMAVELYDYLSGEHDFGFTVDEKKEMFRLAKEVFNRKAPHFGDDSYKFLMTEARKKKLKDKDRAKQEAITETKRLIKEEVEKWYKSLLVRKFLLDRCVKGERWDLVDQFGNKLQKVEI